MGVIDEVLKANDHYASKFKLGSLPIPPARKLAIVACMDARISVEEALGLRTGDAHIIRNAGGVVTDDVLRSLIISHNLLGTNEFIVVNHTDCGMLTFKDEDLRDRLTESTGTAAVVPTQFHPFSDLEKNVRQQVQRIRQHPWLSNDVAVRGFIYDVKDGRLREVNGA